MRIRVASQSQRAIRLSAGVSLTRETLRDRSSGSKGDQRVCRTVGYRRFHLPPVTLLGMVCVKQPWSGAAAPVIDAVVVGGEAVVDAPQHRLGAAADVDLPVDRADVGLHGVGAEEGQGGDLGVALALGDQGEDFGFPVGQALAATRPVQPAGAAGARRRSLTTISPAWTASSAATRSRAGSVFDR